MQKQPKVYKSTQSKKAMTNDTDSEEKEERVPYGLAIVLASLRCHRSSKPIAFVSRMHPSARKPKMSAARAISTHIARGAGKTHPDGVRAVMPTDDHELI
jgi:hypothetical protein